MVVFGCVHYLICCLFLLLMPVLAPISVNSSCFSIYFPTFTSFFPPSPWNLIRLSPFLWRLKIRLSTSQVSSTSGNVEKEENDKKEGAIGDWGWGPPVTWSRSMYYVIWGKVLVNIVFQDASIYRRRIIWYYYNRAKTSFILVIDSMNHIAFVYIKYHKWSLTICDGCFDTLKSSKMRS